MKKKVNGERVWLVHRCCHDGHQAFQDYLQSLQKDREYDVQVFSIFVARDLGLCAELEIDPNDLQKNSYIMHKDKFWAVPN